MLSIHSSWTHCMEWHEVQNVVLLVASSVTEDRAVTIAPTMSKTMARTIFKRYLPDRLIPK